LEAAGAEAQQHPDGQYLYITTRKKSVMTDFVGYRKTRQTSTNINLSHEVVLCQAVQTRPKELAQKHSQTAAAKHEA
jgi:hypothetical protein